MFLVNLGDIFSVNLEPFFDGLSNVVSTIYNSFSVFVSILNAFINRVSSSNTILSSFIIFMFGCFVITVVVRIWRE